ncbi:MAG TPA: CHAT domain-containing protein, partial [Vicinamibacteria bacterium]|nr:CHAT domain-containing protein [Vicinamibacteria bacterium]
TESRVGGQEQVDGRLVERRRRLRQQVARQVEAQVRQPGATAEPATRRLETELHEVEAEIRRLRPRYADLAELRPTTAREVQKSLLDGGTVLLAYALGDARSALWVVTRETLEMHPLPPRARLESLVRETHTSMSRPGAARGSASRELARILLEPAIPRLRDRVLVVADGALNYVSFGALPDPRGGVFLDRQEVVASPSASTIRLLQRAPPAPSASATVRRVAIFADPVFRADDERIAPSHRARSPAPLPPSSDVTRATRDVGGGLERLSRLPFTRREARQIASLAKRPHGAALALDFEANLQNLGEWKLADYRFVHFATHGFLNTRRPELSGLVLSLYDRDGRPRPGFLSSLDAFNLDLSADVVTLSGCRTALGKDVRGEGLVGVSQAFLYAGARRVVSSLWAVDDLATSALMARFYEGLLAPQPLRPAAALRDAQAYVRSRPQWRHPYYWAGFQLLGDWN